MRLGVKAVVLVAMLLGACSGGAGAPEKRAAEPAGAGVATADRYLAEVEQWRAERLARLRAPDGWLSYTGSGRLRPGTYRVGSAAGNDIVLPGGPPRLGMLALDAERGAHFRAHQGSGVRLRGEPVSEAVLEMEQPGRRADRLELGAAEFYVVRTGPIFGWRYRDPQAPALRAFAGIEHFPVDAQWRIQAQWRPYPRPREVMLLTSIGTPLAAKVPGEAVFRHNGRPYRLYPVMAEDGQRLFFPFADRTSGKETYGGARYLYADPPRDGQVMLDFNRAQNPPCALTPHLVCPIAPPENRLDLAVDAGEKTYVAPH